MIVAVTGTPGTGKTTATQLLADHPADYDVDLEVVHLNEVIREEGLTAGHDEDRDSAVADLEAVRAWLGDRVDVDRDAIDRDEIDRDDVHRADVLVESHLAHHLDADRVVVLRCAPAEIERRLKERGESEDSARENAESEALDVILAEAVDRHGRESIYEIDATDLTPEAVATEIAAVVAGERDPSAGEVSFVDYL